MARITPVTTIRPLSLSSDRRADELRSRLLFKLGIYDTKFINASIYHKVHRNQQQEQEQQKRRCRQVVYPIFLKQDCLQDEITSVRFLEPIKFAQDDNDDEEEDVKGSFEDSEGSTSLTVSTSLGSSSSSIDVDDEQLLSGSIPDPPISLMSRLFIRPSSLPYTDDRPTTATTATTNTTNPLLKSRRRRPRKRSVHFHPTVSIIPIPSRTSYTSYTKSKLYISKQDLMCNAQRNHREFVYENFDWRSAVEEDEMYSPPLHDSTTTADGSGGVGSGDLIHPANYGW
jgi:hypothetical protein